MAQPANKQTPDLDDDLIGDVDDAPETLSTNLFDVLGGVSATWLQQVFGGDRNVVMKKLATSRCKVVGRNKGAPLYSLKEAAACLIKPKFDVDEYMQSMRYNDLPPMLQAAYWDGKKKKQEYEIKAGELWHTSDVQAVLGDTFFSFTTTVKLWVEEVDRTNGLTHEQRATIGKLTDKLLDSVHRMLVEAPQRGQTQSSIVDPLEDEDATDAV